MKEKHIWKIDAIRLVGGNYNNAFYQMKRVGYDVNIQLLGEDLIAIGEING